MDQTIGFIPYLARRNIAPHAEMVRWSCFHAKKLLAKLVYDAAVLEGNPYTFPEVQTLLEGITVGGHKLSDQQQIMNLRDGWLALIGDVAKGCFRLDKETFCRYQALVAREEALTWGVFRNGLVSIAGTEFMPPEPERLETLFLEGVRAIQTLDPYNRGLHFFLFGSLHQFFYDGNKRTARLMMNGVLMSHGRLSISIPAERKQEFNEVMIRFYDTRQAKDAIEFLVSCDERNERMFQDMVRRLGLGEDTDEREGRCPR